MPPSRSSFARAGRVVAAVAVGLLGAWLGLAVFGNRTVAMGPFQVRLTAGLGRGVTDIGLPPLGQVTADTHLAPLRLSATLQNVDVVALRDDLATGTVDDLAATVERDALDSLVPLGLVALRASLVGAVGLALLVFRTNLRAVGVAALAALVAVGGGAGLARATFRAEAFLTPTYAGTLSLAPELIGPIRAVGERIGYFREALTQVVGGAVRAYTAVDANPLEGDEIVALHISDVHLSALGFEFAQEIASGFDVDLVIDTGDVTSFGSPAETLMLRFLPGFERPYVFVRGSHDSIALQEAARGVPNAIVLDGRAAEVAGLTIYGLGHPVFVSRRGQPLEDASFEERARTAAEQIRADLESEIAAPDLVAVHDDRMAEGVAGLMPLVASGHFHENAARVLDGTLFLRVGTTGGAGPTSFTEEGDVPLSAEILYFEPGDPAALVAWDVIQQLPATGDLTVTRHLVAEEFGSLTPSPATTPATASPAASTTPSP